MNSEEIALREQLRELDGKIKWYSDRAPVCPWSPQFATSVYKGGSKYGEGVEVSPEQYAKSKVAQSDANQACDVRPVQVTHVNCLDCGSTGELTFLTMKIPNFNDAEIMSFSCSDCGYGYRKVRTGLSTKDGKYAVKDKGVKIKLNVESLEDLKREVVRSDTCVVSVPKIQLEVALGEGAYTTVEGLLDGIVTNLKFMHVSSDVDATEASRRPIDTGIPVLLDVLLNDGESFELILDDPMGDSAIAPLPGVDLNHDARLTVEHYERSEATAADLGLVENPYVAEDKVFLKLGQHVEAQYQGKWYNCRVVSTNEDHTINWVEEIGREDQGKWMAGLHELKVNHRCLDASGTNQLSAEQLLQAANDYAAHVEASENVDARNTEPVVVQEAPGIDEEMRIVREIMTGKGEPVELDEDEIEALDVVD